MDLDDLDEDEVRDYYTRVVEQNSFLRELKEKYESKFRDDEEAVTTARKEVSSGIDQAKKHDSMLTSTVSAFLPGGPIETDTGWVFRGAEPLSEYNESNADAIFCNPNRNMALIVECKTSVSSPGNALNQLYDAAQAVREHEDELSEKIGMPIDDLEAAICVPSYHDEQIAHRIEEEEKNGDAEEHVYVWRLHYLQEGERLDLFTSFTNRSQSEATHNSELSQLLNRGVEITKKRQATPSFYPSSHTFQIMEAAFAQILKNRINTDDPLREFADVELRQILTSQRHLPHYSPDTVGARIYEGLIDRLLADNLITQIEAADTELTNGDEYYRYRVRGRSVETVLNNLKSDYREQALNRKLEFKAMEAAINEFDEKQRSLDDYL
jgi:hypothetical protein